jgi:hypothetical protein
MEEWRSESAETETEKAQNNSGIIIKKKDRATEKPRQSAFPTEPDIFGIIRHFGTGDAEHQWVWRAISRHFLVGLMRKPINLLAYEA